MARKNYNTLGYIFGDKSKLDYEIPDYGAPKLKEGFSFDKAYQGQKPAGQIPWTQTRGAGGGRQTTRGSTPYYEKVAPPSKSAPPSAPAPKPASVQAKATPTNNYQTQIAQLTKSLSTNQAALDKAIADSKSYQDTINSLKIGFDEQLKTLQSDYAAQTKDLISKYGLQISGLEEGFQTKFEEQEASFVERLSKQQKGFDVSMANQQIAGKAANLQIGSNRSDAAQQGGTAGFRKRGLQFNTPAYAGLSINSGNINI